MDTPTNLPFSSAGPVLGTKLPSRMPITMASRIQSASKRSSQPRALKADDGSLSETAVDCCFSVSIMELRVSVIAVGSIASCFGDMATDAVLFARVREGLDDFTAVLYGEQKSLLVRLNCSKRQMLVNRCTTN